MAESDPQVHRVKQPLHSRKTITLIAMAGLVFVALFDVSIPLQFAATETIQAPDPDAESAYARCYQVRDEEMHRAVFGAIDNPDVQKEMITTNRESIARECRQQFPEKLITVERAVPSNLVDLKPRFW